MKFCFSVGLLLGLAACGPARIPIHLNPSTGIIGGSEVPAQSLIARSVVGLEANDGINSYLCTGVIIAKNAVLTAAHCGVNLKQGELIFSTTLSTATIDQKREVEDVQISPEFADASESSNDWGDLAILRFSGGLPKGYGVAQAGNGKQLANGDSVIVAGFGLTDAQAQTPSDSLRGVEVQVQDAGYSTTEFSVDQSTGAGVCHGDSGGPAFAEYNNHLYVVGITSRGSDTECAELAVETKVSSYVKWINETLGNL